MKVALPTIAMLGGQLVTPISDRVPKLNVEAACARPVSQPTRPWHWCWPQATRTLCATRMPRSNRSFPIWIANSDKVRDECEGEATVAGTENYVDLLTCLQWRASTYRTRPRPRSEAQGYSSAPLDSVLTQSMMPAVISPADRLIAARRS